MIEAWFDCCCEPRNPGGHAAWGGAVYVDGESIFRAGGYCGFGPQMSNNVAEYSAFCAVADRQVSYRRNSLGVVQLSFHQAKRRDFYFAQ